MAHVVRIQDVEDAVRAAIRVHAREAKHPNQDVVIGCKTCALMLAINVWAAREMVCIELPDDRAPRIQQGE